MTSLSAQKKCSLTHQIILFLGLRWRFVGEGNQLIEMCTSEDLLDEGGTSFIVLNEIRILSVSFLIITKQNYSSI